MGYLLPNHNHIQLIFPELMEVFAELKPLFAIILGVCEGVRDITRRIANKVHPHALSHC